MVSKKIIAIGGGEIGKPGTQIETEEIDKETMRLSGKKHPKLLFIPTASKDSQGYIDVVRKYFGDRLGCEVDSLLLKREKYSKEEIKNRILGSDIIYVGGGNTLQMMKSWRKLGVDKLLKQAYEKGVILTGVSAGSICWFEYGQSDSWKTKENPNANYIKVTGLRIIPGLHAPHFTREQERISDLRKIMKRTSGVAVALEDCCALEIIDNKYRILTSKPEAKAYRCYWKAGEYHSEEIPKLREFVDLSELLKK